MEKLRRTTTRTKRFMECVRASTSPRRFVQRAGMLLDDAAQGTRP